MTVLIPLDFSTASKQAFRYAGFLSKRLKAKIHLIHVFEIPIIATDSYVYMPPPDEIRKIKENHIMHMEEFVRHELTNENESTVISYQCDYGNAAEQILAYSKSIEADLIIMGIQGKCVRPKFFMGSTFTYVMNHSKIPVIGLHGKEINFELRNILFAYDLNSLKNHKILNSIYQLASYFEAKIHVLNVCKEISNDPMLASKLLNEQFDPYLNKISIIFHVIQSDSILEGVKEFLSNQTIDLICFVPREHPLIFRLFNDSISNKAAFDIDLPFMSIHN